MDKFKKCLSLILMALCCAYTIDGISQATKESKQMIIIKKTIDDNGKETIEKNVYDGDALASVDIDELLMNDINGDMDISISLEKPKLGVVVESNDDGAKIVEVIPESPAADAGLKVGDVIYGLGETPISNTDDLIVNLKEVEDKVYIAYYRDGKPGGMWVTLAPFEFKSSSKETNKERIIM